MDDELRRLCDPNKRLKSLREKSSVLVCIRARLLSIIGAQPPGIAETQSEYPNLRTLPIDSTNSALEAIPTMWPRYRLETIPTQWPMHEMVPVGSRLEVTAQSPGN
jgi:hypothetical protein